MPRRETYSPDEAAELNRLFDALPVAIKLASDLLTQSSSCDPEYLAADGQVCRILGRISELMN